MKSILSLIHEGYKSLSTRGKRTVWSYTVALTILAGIDGLALVILSQKVITSTKNETRLDKSSLISVLLVVALFLLRSAIAAGLSWIVYLELAEEEVLIGNKNFEQFLNTSWQDRKNILASTLFTTVDRGPTALVLTVLMLGSTLMAEILGALVLFIFFAALQPIPAFSGFIFFTLVVVVQHHFLSKGSARTGSDVLTKGDRVFDLLGDAFSVGKLLSVMPSHSLHGEIASTRRLLAVARAKSAFYESFPRYLMESLLAIGIVGIGGTIYFINGPEQVIPALALFAVAGYRLLPSINRIQGLVLGIYGRAPLAREGLTGFSHYLESRINPDGLRPNQVALNSIPDSILTFNNVSFSYSSQEDPTLHNINIDFVSGLQYAVVGPSGAGKTTLVDLCLGLLTPTGGSICWNTGKKKPTIAYVPQETNLIIGTLKQNIALEWSEKFIEIDAVTRSMRESQLSRFEGLIQPESSGARPSLSGGEKQRVGIARALYRNPDFLVLDEATSSLDAETENEITNIIYGLKKKVTVLIVAHRISTIRNADVIIYIDQGQVLGMGTFRALLQQIPAFARQVSLGTQKPTSPNDEIY